jgi:hypothetical protein
MVVNNCDAFWTIRSVFIISVIFTHFLAQLKEAVGLSVVKV